jgi:hypothetical protein
MEVIPISFLIVIVLAVIFFIIGMLVNRVRDGEWNFIGYYNIFIGMLTVQCLFFIWMICVSLYVVGNYIITI